MALVKGKGLKSALLWGGRRLLLSGISGVKSGWTAGDGVSLWEPAVLGTSLRHLGTASFGDWVAVKDRVTQWEQRADAPAVREAVGGCRVEGGEEAVGNLDEWRIAGGGSVHGNVSTWEQGSWDVARSDYLRPRNVHQELSHSFASSPALKEQVRATASFPSSRPFGLAGWRTEKGRRGSGSALPEEFWKNVGTAFRTEHSYAQGAQKAAAKLADDFPQVPRTSSLQDRSTGSPSSSPVKGPFGTTLPAITPQSSSTPAASTATPDSTVRGASSVTAAAGLNKPTPEECDRAVETLLETRAKALKAYESRYGSNPLVGRIIQVGRVMGAVAMWFPKTLVKVPGWIKHIASMDRAAWATTLGGWWKTIKHEAHHYWTGTKLLAYDVNIAARLTYKVLQGKHLTRRQKKQLTQTVADVFRLVPMIIIVIIPFMELALPFILRIFPNMLPSTFQDSMKKEEELRKKVVVKLELAKFLQDTVEEMAKQASAKGGESATTAEELAEFIAKARSGSSVSNADIIKFGKLFNDELTLDNLNRTELVSMCKYMDVPYAGTDNYLRSQIRKRLEWIKKDDRLIQAEGVDSLNAQELREACRARAMRWTGLDNDHLRAQLEDWLDLSLNHALPSSLLIMSRAFMYSTVRVSEDDALHALQDTLSMMPEEVLQDVGMQVLKNASREQRLEYLSRERERIIEEERRLRERERQAKEKARKEAAAAAAAAQAAEDVALSEMTDLAEISAAEKQALKVAVKEEAMRDVAQALSVMAGESSVSKEREEFLQLVKEQIDLHEDLLAQDMQKQRELLVDEAEEVAKAAEAADAAAAAAAVSSTLPPSKPDVVGLKQKAEELSVETEVVLTSVPPPQAPPPPPPSPVVEDELSKALLERVNGMIQSLEKDMDEVDSKIGNRLHKLDLDGDGKITTEELKLALKDLRSTMSQQELETLIKEYLAQDIEGKISLQDIIKLAKEDDEEEDESSSGDGASSSTSISPAAAKPGSKITA